MAAAPNSSAWLAARDLTTVTTYGDGTDAAYSGYDQIDDEADGMETESDLVPPTATSVSFSRSRVTDKSVKSRLYTRAEALEARLPLNVIKALTRDANFAMEDAATGNPQTLQVFLQAILQNYAEQYVNLVIGPKIDIETDVYVIDFTPLRIVKEYGQVMPAVVADMCLSACFKVYSTFQALYDEKKLAGDEAPDIVPRLLPVALVLVDIDLPEKEPSEEIHKKTVSKNAKEQFDLVLCKPNFNSEIGIWDAPLYSKDGDRFTNAGNQFRDQKIKERVEALGVKLQGLYVDLGCSRTCAEKVDWNGSIENLQQLCRDRSVQCSTSYSTPLAFCIRALDEMSTEQPLRHMRSQFEDFVHKTIKNNFMGWHNSMTDDEGQVRTASARAIKTHRTTGQLVKKHMDQTDAHELVENTHNGSLMLEKKLVETLNMDAEDITDVDDAYRVLLTLLFNGGKGTLMRGDTPLILINPTVVRVHGQYATSLATECTVRGFVEPSASFALVEQIVIQELMTEYNTTKDLYDPQRTMARYRRKVPPKHALWHRIKQAEEDDNKPPITAREILMVQCQGLSEFKSRTEEVEELLLYAQNSILERKRELEILTELVNDKDKKIRKIEGESAALKDLIDEQTIDTKRKTVEIASLQKKISNFKHFSTELLDQRNEIQTELERQQTKHKNDIAMAEADHRHKVEELMKIQEREIEKKEAEAAETAKGHEAIVTVLKFQHDQRIEKLEREFAESQNQVEANHAKAIEDLNRRRENNDKQLQAVETQLKDLQRAYNNQQMDLALAREVTAVAENKQKKAENRLRNQKASNVTLRKQIEELQTSVRETEQKHAEQIKLIDENAKRAIQLASERAAAALPAKDESDFAVLESANEQLRAENKRLREEIDALGGTLDEDDDIFFDVESGEDDDDIAASKVVVGTESLTPEDCLKKVREIIKKNINEENESAKYLAIETMFDVVVTCLGRHGAQEGSHALGQFLNDITLKKAPPSLEQLGTLLSHARDVPKKVKVIFITVLMYVEYEISIDPTKKDKRKKDLLKQLEEKSSDLNLLKDVFKDLDVQKLLNEPEKVEETLHEKSPKSPWASFNTLRNFLVAGFALLALGGGALYSTLPGEGASGGSTALAVRHPEDAFSPRILDTLGDPIDLTSYQPKEGLGLPPGILESARFKRLKDKDKSDTEYPVIVYPGDTTSVQGPSVLENEGDAWPPRPNRSRLVVRERESGGGAPAQRPKPSPSAGGETEGRRLATDQTADVAQPNVDGPLLTELSEPHKDRRARLRDDEAKLLFGTPAESGLLNTIRNWVFKGTQTPSKASMRRRHAATSFRMSQISKTGVTETGHLEKPRPKYGDDPDLRPFSEARIKLATNTAAAFQAAAVIFVGQSDGGTKFRDRSGREAARMALLLAVRAMLYDV